MRAIAIDGPAGAGKSSVAGAVAERLGFLYVDTGAMYRAIALKATRLGIDLESEEAMGAVARDVHLAFDASGKRILLDGEDVSAAIRTPAITNVTRFSARAAPVRQVLVARQQEIARERPVVMEGRDITTVVLPEARWKFFLTAAPEERAMRRVKEMREAGHDVDFEKILEDIKARDLSDLQVGPMKKALEIAGRGTGEIRLIDTTSMTPDAVVETIVRGVRGEVDG